MATQPVDDATRQQKTKPTPIPRTHFVDLRWLLVFALVGVTILIYQPVWRAGFVWDDQQNVTDNQLLRTVNGLQEMWVNPRAAIQYYPLTYAGFWIEYHLWRL
ncbi:MAG TPA: hypothetical protein VLZ12_14210, partial [Verrucomicrobiae bacterium]|nr:hypothetical protein [Verrucomicrobiae bacterium]